MTNINECNNGICSTKFEVMEEKVSDLKSRVDNFDSIRDVLIELKLLTAQQIEANMQRDLMVQEQGIVLAKTVSAIEQLTQKLERTEKTVEELNRKFVERSDKGVIHLNDILKGAVLMILGAVGTAIVSGIIK